MRKRLLVILLALFFSVNAESQGNYFHLGRVYSQGYSSKLNQLDTISHSSVRPLNSRWTNEAITQFEVDSSKSGWLYRKFKRDHLIDLRSEGFSLTIDPLFNFNYGKDIEDNSARAQEIHFVTNTRAAIVTGRIGEAVTFSSSFYENQTYFRGYIDDHIRGKSATDGYGRLTGIVPGQGRVKAFKEQGFDYAIASSNVTITPNKRWSLSLGNGKHFIGDGYRSLFLSDNASNYPFLSTTLKLGKLQYTTIYSTLQNYYRMPGFATADALFQRKNANFSYLSWNVSPKVQIGFFEGIIWESQSVDGSNISTFNYNYLNPVIFTRSLQYSLDYRINALVGVSAKAKLFEGGVLYGQLMIDEWNKRKKTGYQVGLKIFNAFRIPQLYAQVEYNTISAFSYSQVDSSQSYGHMYDALAHPMGANFNEAVAIVNYNWKDVRFGVKYVIATKPVDSLNRNVGNNIFRSEYYATSIKGIKSDVSYLDVNVSYLLNRKTDMRITLGLSTRKYKYDNIQEISHFVYVAFRTSLANSYFDF
ncbi:MAG: hypothetical protein HRT72_05220 [Flavobacteriales bacterium]|nr:hypothetical protein [Flavobacteriales bacterium]